MPLRRVQRISRLSLTLAAVLLAGCSAHRPVRQTQAGPIRAPVPSSLSFVSPKVPVPVRVPPGLPFRELNLNSLRQRVPVLTYHDVIASRTQPDAVWFDCTLSEFEAQMTFLHDQGAHVITLAQLQRHLTTGERLPDKAIALTFDDSYQGVYDHAVPVLRQYGFPATVFVHTDFVGSAVGRPKMTWEELRDLDRSGLMTIGSHSRSHPADMGLLTAAQQDDELQGSKAALERNLGHPISFISYPNGKASPATFERARLAGYTLGFMEEWGPVEQSPGILALNRYIHIQLPRAWAEAYGPEALPQSEVAPLVTTAMTTEQTVAAGVRLTITRGGVLRAQLPVGRTLSSSDYLPVRAGPVKTAADSQTVWLSSHSVSGQLPGPYMAMTGPFVPELNESRLVLLQGRPLVAWNRERLAILPFVPGLMNTARQYQGLLPGLQGLFVAGAWLVQDGRAFSTVGIRATATLDLRILRPRVFLGVSAAGIPLLGVSSGEVTARQLALAAVASGAQQAVLVY